jgi:hypothetical protein
MPTVGVYPADVRVASNFESLEDHLPLPPL